MEWLTIIKYRPRGGGICGDKVMRLAIVLIGTLALGGCAGDHVRKAAICDGKHRRPANLYGTVLPTLPVPLPATQGGGQSMVLPGPAAGPDALPPAPAPAPPSTPDLRGAAPAPGTDSATPPAPRTSQGGAAPAYRSC